MSMRANRLAPLVCCASMGAVLLAFVFLGHPLGLPEPPDSFEARVAWVASHPADWLSVSRVSDEALDSGLPRRLELWRESFALADRLAPLRTNPRSGFVRAGLFHWYELAPADRRRVLDVAAPLMREASFFDRMVLPVFQLTRDLAWLRRVAPDVLGARRTLRNIAIRYDRWDDYRALRSEIRQKRLAQMESVPLDAPIETLLSLMPRRFDVGDEPLVRRLLHELERRPFNPEKITGIEAIVEFAIARHLEPLIGLRPLIEAPGKLRDVTRARAAVEMGDRSLADRIEISTAVADDPQWAPYYLDRARAEAARGEALAAENYLARARLAGVTLPHLAASAAVSEALGRHAVAEEERRKLAATRKGPWSWAGTCSADELCDVARTDVWLTGPGDTATLTLSTSQSDESPPYVELLVDHVLTAEGPVSEGTGFRIRALEAGLHRVEVRLVNRLTRNGVQRRVRLQ